MATTAHEIDRDKAWHYFFHTTLPRRTRIEENGTVRYERVDVGTEPEEGEITELYPLLSPNRDLGDFGIGTGLYFSSRIGIMLLFCIIGLLNVANVAYYNSDSYSGLKSSGHARDVAGSAACDRTAPVCLTQECNVNYDENLTEHENILANDELAMRMSCPPLQMVQGIIDAVSVGLLFLYLALVTISQKQIEISTDVREQTASDYSIVVENPEADDLDPEEWRLFFSKYGHVTYITIGVTNGRLITLLAKRRRTLIYLHMQEHVEGYDSAMAKLKTSDGKGYSQVPQSDDLTSAAGRRGSARMTCGSLCKYMFTGGWIADFIRVTLQGMGFFRDTQYYRNQLHSIDRQLEYVKKTLPVASKVFVTFETEQAQRAALAEITQSKISKWINVATAVPTDARFRYERFLEIHESDEPGEIQWTELDVPFLVWLFWMGIGFAAVGISISAVLLTVYAMLEDDHPPWTIGIVIAFANVIVAPLMSWITEAERHMTVNDAQKSEMLKLICTRWIISIAHAIVLPFPKLLSPLNFRIIRSIFIADSIMKPIMQVLDIPGRLNRRVLSHFARSQETLNSYFKGTDWSIAERYSDVSKSVFLTLYFSAVYPFGYFWCAFSMFVNFMSDKYCLFRLWRQGEPIDSTVSTLYRGFTAFAILVHCFVTLHFFAQWPFDNVCWTDDLVEPSPPLRGEGWPWSEMRLDEPVYKHCNQQHASFLFVHDIEVHPDFMSLDQQRLVAIYKITTMIATGLIAFFYCFEGLKKSVFGMIYGYVEPDTEATDTDFSDVEFIDAYIPGFVDPVFGTPLLACELDFLDEKHISWEGNFDMYNLDSEIDMPGMDEETRHDYFSIVRFYPPEDEPQGTYLDYLKENETEIYDRIKHHIMDTDEPKQ